MANLDVVVSAIDNTRQGLASAGRNIDNAEKKTGKFGGIAKVAGAAVGGLAIAGAAAGVALVKNFLDTGDALHKMSIRTGVSVEKLQEMKFAAEQSGSSMEQFSKAILKQSRFLEEARLGTSGQVDALAELGLEYSDLEGLDPQAQFKEIAEAMSGLESESKRAALAQEIFGGAGKDLIPLLAEGKDGIEALTAQARENGNIMSTSAAESAAAFNDQLNILKQKGLAVVQKAMSALIPVLLAVIKWIETGLVPWVKEATMWLREHLGPTFKTIGDIMVTTAEVMRTVWDALWIAAQFTWENAGKPLFDSIVAVVKVWWDVQQAVYKAMRAGWDALWSAFRTVWERVGKPIFEAIKTAVSGVSSAIGAVSGAIGAVGGFLGFASGGVVPGPKGAPMLAVVHGGETITPPGHAGPGGGGPIVANLIVDRQNIGQFVLGVVRDGQRAGAI